ncbi:MAG: SPASM domain-containing protein [Caldisericia bacterium]|nr:SPASM domain-containing protein [Caldisericia bacterium]MDD5689036.1 SPASM domain-containing protein [Caldisericia bacterium]
MSERNRLKVSKYNHILKLNCTRINSSIVFNALTCALIELNDIYVSSLHLTKPGNKLSKKILNEKGYKDIVEQLTYGGFLLNQNFDELSFLRYLSNSSRYSSKAISLTILPTLRCNFKCIYCYEDHPNQTMTPDVEEKLVEIIQKRLESGSSSLFIEWYGGEPLLCLDIVERLSKRFIAFSKKYNIPFSAGMVTNGYLLNRKVINLLKELNIKRFQITLDGPPNVHNERRKLYSNGRKTFDKILENISLASEESIAVVLRINADKTNFNTLDELLNILNDYKFNEKNVSPYLGFVKATTTACRDRIEYCFSEEEFAMNNADFIRKLFDYGFKNYSFPSPSYHLCGAVTDGVYAISPNGDLFKCWETVSIPEERVGNILDNKPRSEDQINLLKWMTYDPFKINKCKKCNIFPICFGGCPSASVKHISGKIFRDVSCNTYKHNIYLNKMMEIVYSKYLRGDFKKEEEAKKERLSKDILNKEESKDKSTANSDNAQEDIKDKSSQDLEN